VIVAPFDTELFGHWWFEGPDFLAAAYRALRGRSVRAVTASQHLEAHPPRVGLQLAEGSWGANGDHSMWLNERTKWTWDRLRPLEKAFWDAAPAALASPGKHALLAQAARELLLAQSSDWQFIISTGAVVDYAERRFTLHADDAERLIRALTGTGTVDDASLRALAERDAVFPDVLAAVKGAVGR
jgi:1,4-alpha-glucan branching enzyme